LRGNAAKALYHSGAADDRRSNSFCP
jgi:hypothetical protein